VGESYYNLPLAPSKGGNYLISPFGGNGANLEYFIIYISCKLLALFGAGIAYQVFAFEGSLS
jgi:hypothetical protein